MVSINKSPWSSHCLIIQSHTPSEGVESSERKIVKKLKQRQYAVQAIIKQITVAGAGHRVPVDVLCPLCRHEPESLDHLMKDYESVVPIWQTILTNNIPGIGQGCITWLCDILSRGEAVLKLHITAAWWSIWRARNELVWNGKPWQLNTVVNEIQRSMETWQNLGNITAATSIPSHAWQENLDSIPTSDDSPWASSCA
nr:putative ribonuclease H protein [Ipomoea batatas]